MYEIARKLDKAERESLLKCASYLCKMLQYAYAAEIYTKLDDRKQLALLYVESKNWDEVYMG